MKKFSALSKILQVHSDKNFLINLWESKKYNFFDTRKSSGIKKFFCNKLWWRYHARHSERVIKRFIIKNVFRAQLFGEIFSCIAFPTGCHKLWDSLRCDVNNFWLCIKIGKYFWKIDLNELIIVGVGFERLKLIKIIKFSPYFKLKNSKNYKNFSLILIDHCLHRGLITNCKFTI